MLNEKTDFSQMLAQKADAYDMQEILKAKASVNVTNNLEYRLNNVENRTSEIVRFINDKICPVIRVEVLQ